MPQKVYLPDFRGGGAAPGAPLPGSASEKSPGLTQSLDACRSIPINGTTPTTLERI